MMEQQFWGAPGGWSVPPGPSITAGTAETETPANNQFSHRMELIENPLTPGWGERQRDGGRERES
jgi:hypothetical protein